MNRSHLVGAISVAVIALGVAGSAHADKHFNFSYSFPRFAGGTVSASGVLTTTDFDTMLGAYTITGITGTRTFEGVTDNITGLVAPGGYGGNDNLLFATEPLLDGNGFTFTLDANNGNFGNQVNVYFSPAYSEFDPDTDYGDFTVTAVANVPEPGVVAFGVIAAGSVLGMVARKRKK